jgi:hypothetical protein
VLLPWYRIFGTSDTQPEPAAVLAGLRARGHEVTGHFRGDDRGWFRAELLPAAGSPLEVECYLADEEDIRHELNSWAAWLEAAGDSEQHAGLMRHMIATSRLFTVHPADAADALCVALCELLAEATAGVYQIDGRGFFAADGTLLVAED